MTHESANPGTPADVAYGCALYVFALAIVGVLVLLALLTRGFVVLLLPPLIGVWMLARRWPPMRIPLVFTVGLTAVLVAAGEVIIQMEIFHIGSRPAAVGVLVFAFTVIVLLFRWAWRRSWVLITR